MFVTQQIECITYGCSNTFDKDKFDPIKNRDHMKPYGGLWASPIATDYGWKDWCELTSYRSLDTQFTFLCEGRILKIDDIHDLSQIYWRKLCRVTWISEYVPDYEKMAVAGIDAIWLTKNGQDVSRFSEPCNLYGWDCECILIMNPNIIDEKGV